MPTVFGWSGKILRINLTSRVVSEIPTAESASVFIGGRGLASSLYWQHTGGHTTAFDADSPLFFMNGPLSGTGAPAASRWIVLGKSPMASPEQYACGNLGGRLGAALKWAGCDGLMITGASERPVVIVISSGGRLAVEDATGLWGLDTFTTIDRLQKTFGRTSSVATIGRAGEMRVRFATIIGSGGVSATKGFGAVMGSKRLKALVVAAGPAAIPVARPDELKKVRAEIAHIHAGEGSGRYGQDLMLEGVEKLRGAYCYGCPGICGRGLYQSSTKEQGFRKTCVSAFFYSAAEKARSGSMGKASFHATQLANMHGLCTLELRFLVTWLPEALRRGSADARATGLDPDGVGSSAWIDTLVELIVTRKGLGDLLAEGSRRAAPQLGAEDLLEGMVTRNGFDANVYNPRMFLSTAALYATEPVFPITQLHEISFPMVQWMVWWGTEGMLGFLTTEKLRQVAETFWGDRRAAEFDSPEAMGSAAVRIQNRSYAKENLVLCDWFWPLQCYESAETGAGDPALEARLLSAVTGEDMDEAQFLLTGERCATLCRAIFLREGRGGRTDDTLEQFNFSLPLERQGPPIDLFNPDLLLPGKNGELCSRMGAAVKPEHFRRIMDDYYTARGWDMATGLPTRRGLQRLKLDMLLPELQALGAVVDAADNADGAATATGKRADR